MELRSKRSEKRGLSFEGMLMALVGDHEDGVNWTSVTRRLGGDMGRRVSLQRPRRIWRGGV